MHGKKTQRKVVFFRSNIFAVSRYHDTTHDSYIYNSLLFWLQLVCNIYWHYLRNLGQQYIYTSQLNDRSKKFCSEQRLLVLFQCHSMKVFIVVLDKKKIGHVPKLYIPSSINTWMKLLSKYKMSRLACISGQITHDISFNISPQLIVAARR